MAKKTPQINVELKKGKHPTQPYTFTINKPGPAGKETKKERFATTKTAKRGAMRQLGCWNGSVANDQVLMVDGKDHIIHFTLAGK